LLIRLISKYKVIFEVDISKDVFDVYGSKIGHNQFKTASQLCSYVGITPTIRQSGSSVRGRSRISKIRNNKLRNLLFLCSFSACKHNKACREIYERIVNKGKSKKLALIAVSNKLLKQAFAIAKSGHPYDETFVSVLITK
jgi:transposase